MSQAERWQLGGNAPEVYESQLVPAIFEPWAPLLVAQAVLCAGERVLDVACGTGVVTRLVAQQVGATGHVVGLDLNPGMLAPARAAAPPGGAAVNDTAREGLIREVIAAMHPYGNDDGLPFPIEGQIAVTRP